MEPPYLALNAGVAVGAGGAVGAGVAVGCGTAVGGGEVGTAVGSVPPPQAATTIETTTPSISKNPSAFRPLIFPIRDTPSPQHLPDPAIESGFGTNRATDGA